MVVLDKIPNYATSGVVLSNIQPLEEISDRGGYTLNIYGKINGAYPITITLAGPVMNICDVLSTIMMKSVIAGEYTAPPAQGPMITEI